MMIILEVYVYSASGVYDSSFDLNSENASSQGIAFAYNKLYVIDNGTDKVYAYSTSGTYDSSSSFDFIANTSPQGITFGNNKLWISDTTNDKVYAYEIGSLQRTINVNIDTRSSTDTANTINAYLESNSLLSAASLTTAKVHMYKWSLPTS